MKIVFLNPSAELGGAERMLLDAIASLRDSLPAGSSLHLIALADGPLLDAARTLGVATHLLPMPPSISRLGDSTLRNDRKLRQLASLSLRLALATPTLTLYLRQLSRLIGEIAPDVIHSNGIKTHVLSRFVVRAAPQAALVWQVHDLISERPLLGKVLHRFGGRVSAMIAVSNAVASDLRERFDGVHIETVLNAIDVDHFSPGDARTAELDREAGFQHRDSVVRIGLIATYARWKGHDVFLEAAARAIGASPRPRLQFYIIGGPIYATAGSQFSRTELLERAQALGIAEHVGFVNFLLDPVEAYRALDVVVHASTTPEPFGRTIVEAMSCGRTAIVTRAGGAAELFNDGIDALGVEPRNPMALAGAILTLAGDPVLCEKLGNVARLSALQRFDRRRLGPALLAVYQNLQRNR